MSASLRDCSWCSAQKNKSALIEPHDGLALESMIDRSGAQFLIYECNWCGSRWERRRPGTYQDIEQWRQL